MAKTFASLLKDAGNQLESHHYADATETYRAALKIQPGNAAASMGLAMVYNRTGQHESALKLLQGVWKAIGSSKAKKIVGSKAAVLVQIGLAQQQLGRLTDALQNFRQAHSLFPSTELAERIEKLSSAVDNPNTIEHLLILANQLRHAGKLEQAVNTYHTALQLNADHPDALHGLGLTLRAQKDLDGALPLIQQAIILAPDRADYYNDLGMVFQERGELDKAVSFHKRALKLNADFVPAYINLGVAYKRQGKFDEAISAYHQAIALQPDLPEAHNNLGNLLRNMGDLVGAQASLEQALKIKPDYVDAQQNLTELLALVGAETKKVRAKSKSTTKKT